MKLKSLAPKYLISSQELNTIVRTKHIVCAEIDTDKIDIINPNRTIVFTLENNIFVYWNYEKKEKAIEDFLKIRDLLSKQIID